MSSLLQRLSHSLSLNDRPSASSARPGKTSVASNEEIRQKSPIYSVLNRKMHDIRLLVLEAGRSDTPLKGRLIQLPLRSAEEIGYETISYCWGNPQDKTVIEVNGHRIKVPASAEAALKAFRYLNKERYLWIDSICLNQADGDERNHEVGRMHDIYSRGKANLIWLGHDDGSANEAMRTLKSIMKDIHSSEASRAIFDRQLTTGRYALCNERLINHNPIAILKLLRKPWFTRLWVVQEAALAQRNVVLCGNSEADLVDLLRIPICLWTNRHYLNDETMDLLISCLSQSNTLFDFSDPEYGLFKIDSSARKSLYYLLSTLMQQAATDPRDHVYGLLGLYQMPEAVIPDLLQPNYKKDALTVFRDATRYAIYQSESLDVLQYMLYRDAEDKGYKRLPLSWVPRWDRKFDADVDESRFAHFFDTAPGRPADRQLCGLDASDTIKLRGFCLDSPERARVSTLSGAYKNIESFVDEVLRLINTGRGPREPGDLEKAISRAIIAGVQNDFIAEHNQTSMDFRNILQFREKYGRFPPQPQQLDSKAGDDMRRMSNYMEAIDNACDFRRFFVTAGGRVGIGPRTMQKGDIAAVLYGGDVPYLLRYHKDSKDYEMIGACYIDGIMFGEAARRHWAERREESVFSIR